MTGALQYLESQRNERPDLAEWYASLADLYQRKLWHQLTLKLEQFVALAVVQVCFLISIILFRQGFHYLLGENQNPPGRFGMDQK